MLPELTPAILVRVAKRQTKLTDPCVICGYPFKDCLHTVDDTASVILRVKALTRAEVIRIRTNVPRTK